MGCDVIVVVGRVILFFGLYSLHGLAEAKTRTTDAFMSSIDLKNMFRLEMSMVEVLRKQKAQLEAGLKSIRSYTDEVEALYQGEGCWPTDSCDQDVLDNIVGNPIYNYQMLKRLLVYWKNLEEDMKKIDTKPSLSELKKLKHKYGGMPTNNDLTGAAKALIRLRSTYNIDLQKFSTGNILGLATEAQLNTKDSFFLGRYAYMAGQHYEAKKWLELAAFQVAAEPHNETTVSRSQLDQMLAHLSQKVGHVSSDIEEEGPEDVSKYKLGIVPPKTHDRDKMVTDGDNLNFAALCRGVDLLPVNVAKDLKCYYTTKNDPYYNLHPVQVEVHHPEPHLILSYHNILSNSEADKLVSVAQPRMTQASIGHGKEVSEMRVSRNCWIKDFESGHVDKLSHRFNWLTKLQTSRPLDLHGEGKEEEYEHLQVANYGIGGHYQSHQDPMFVYKEPDFVVYSVQEKNMDPYPTGDRLATLMMYLSDVAKGGSTAFPRLGVAIKPQKGSAVFWYNLKRSGRSDMSMLHGGCPVVLGSKWVANKWIRETANMFHSPCGNHIDV